MLTDELWSKLLPILAENNIHDKSNLRLTVEGILYRMRTGVPRRDLPVDFGGWNNIYKRSDDLLLNSEEFLVLYRFYEALWSTIMS